MTSKQEIVAELGEAELLLPGRIACSLAANDQVKYYFALLQTARRMPTVPAFPPPTSKASVSPAKCTMTFWTTSWQVPGRTATASTEFPTLRKFSAALRRV